MVRSDEHLPARSLSPSFNMKLAKSWKYRISWRNKGMEILQLDSWMSMLEYSSDFNKIEKISTIHSILASNNDDAVDFLCRKVAVLANEENSKSRKKIPMRTRANWKCKHFISNILALCLFVRPNTSICWIATSRSLAISANLIYQRETPHIFTLVLHFSLSLPFSLVCIEITERETTAMGRV